MRQPYRIIAPVAAVALVAVIAFTLIAFHPNRHDGPASAHATATTVATATATSAPSVSFTPSTVTTHGLTIQLDSVDVNALRIAVAYHIVTPPPPHDDYSPSAFVVDDQGLVHGYLAGGPIYPYGTPTGASVPSYFMNYMPPLAPGAPASHTITFTIPVVYLTGPEETHPSSTPITGPWSFTLHVVPTVSGAKTLTAPGQTANGVTITPRAVAWVNGTDPIQSQGMTLQLAVSGLPQVSDPLNHPIPLNMTTDFFGNVAKGLKLSPSTVNLGLPGGKVLQIPAYLSIVSSTFDPAHATAQEFFAGSIGADGSAVIEIGFHGITVTPGETVQLTISSFDLFSGSGNMPHPGPWTFTFTL